MAASHSDDYVDETNPLVLRKIVASLLEQVRVTKYIITSDQLANIRPALIRRYLGRVEALYDDEL